MRNMKQSAVCWLIAFLIGRMIESSNLPIHPSYWRFCICMKFRVVKNVSTLLTRNTIVYKNLYFATNSANDME